MTAALATLAACSPGRQPANQIDATQPPDLAALGNGDDIAPPPTPNGEAFASPGEEWRDYTNRRFAYAISVPPGFVAAPGPQNNDGLVFRKGAAELRVSGSHNALANGFAQQVGHAGQGLDHIKTAVRTATLWRATSDSDEGDHVAILLVRPEDSRLVTARFSWPDGTDFSVAAERALDSLRMIGTAGPLEFRYRPERLAAVDATIALPPNYDRRLDATKLLPPDRRDRLGRDGCAYGLSGRESVCDADKEAGLSFALLDRPIAAIRESLAGAHTRDTTLAGHDGFRIAQDAEGEGVEYRFFPAGDRTVVIERLHRGDERDAGYDAVLDTLRFND